MLNHEVPHYTSAEAMSQISSYFTEVDNAVQMGDTNKRYQPTTNTCYGPPVPVQANSYTTLIISPTADNTADIYNGYIYAVMNINVSANTTFSAWSDTTGFQESPYYTWVGFKDSMDAIEKYEILANGISVYTQNQAIEESFVTSCGSPESVRRADLFSKTRHKNVFNRNKASCGRYIDWAGVSSGTAKSISIKLKIDLRRFLPLSNIKYLPAFAGKIELRVYFSTAGLVCCPCNPLVAFDKGYQDIMSKYQINSVTSEFVPVGQSFTMITGYTAHSSSASGTLTSGTVTLTTDRDYTITACETIIHCFGISNDRYQALVQRYSQIPLTFPTQTLAFTPLSNQLKAASAKSSQTITPRFIDAIFILFPLTPNHRSVYKNPRFTTLQLQCGGYGNIPDVAYGTIYEPRLIESLQNALNLNCDTTCLNKTVLSSMVSKNNAAYTTDLDSWDTTSFLVGFPVETDNTFQQGQTSNTPITYTLTVTQDTTNYYATSNTTVPIMGFLIDSTFSIQIRPDGQPPIVEIGAYDITSPVLA